MTTPRRVDGVDLSHHQGGTLDFAKAKRAGVRWIMHKATEGETYRDPMYATRRDQAKSAGLPFGAYHFARPGRDGDAVSEAHRFLLAATPKPGDLRPALDLETDGGLSPAELREWARTWIAIVTNAIRVKPIVYTPYDLGDVTNGCILWRPRYNDRNTPPTTYWDIWQFSNGVYGVPDSVPGIGHADLNTMRDGLTLDQLLIPKPPPRPPVKRRNRVTEARELLKVALTHRGPVEAAKIRAALKDLEGVK